MLKQCILHLRVRDNHIEISCDSKCVTHKIVPDGPDGGPDGDGL